MYHPRIWAAAVGVMWVAAIVVMSECTAAEIRPGPEHYGAAIDRLLVDRATVDILEREAHAAEVQELLGRLVLIQAVLRARRDDRLDEHARRVRAWAGEPEPAPRGGGWHEVHRP